MFNYINEILMSGSTHAYQFMMDLALILLSTKLLSLITKKIHMPQVVGALLSGIILGPAGLGILQTTDFITMIAEIGVVILMFSAGLESNFKAIRQTGKSALVITLFGSFGSLLLGALLTFIFFNTGLDKTSFLRYMFIGVIITSTSVSITVEALKELGKLNTKVANTILGAALIDDIVGIIFLTVISGFADPSISMGIVFLKIFLYFVFAAVVFIVGRKIFTWWFKQGNQNLRRYSIASLVFCLLLAYISEAVFQVADITGAFLAGITLSSLERTHYVENRINVLSYLFLSPVFFASIGLKVTLSSMTVKLLIFTICLIIITVLAKQIGCFIGARITGIERRDAIKIGAGMVCRGEVSLIAASKGSLLAIPLITQELIGPIVIVVVATTIISPVLIQFFYRNENELKKEQTLVIENKYTDKII